MEALGPFLSALNLQLYLLVGFAPAQTFKILAQVCVLVYAEEIWKVFSNDDSAVPMTVTWCDHKVGEMVTLSPSLPSQAELLVCSTLVYTSWAEDQMESVFCRIEFKFFFSLLLWKLWSYIQFLEILDYQTIARLGVSPHPLFHTQLQFQSQTSLSHWISPYISSCILPSLFPFISKNGFALVFNFLLDEIPIEWTDKVWQLWQPLGQWPLLWQPGSSLHGL